MTLNDPDGYMWDEKEFTRVNIGGFAGNGYAGERQWVYQGGGQKVISKGKM